MFRRKGKSMIDLLGSIAGFSTDPIHTFLDEFASQFAARKELQLCSSMPEQEEGDAATKLRLGLLSLFPLDGLPERYDFRVGIKNYMCVDVKP